MFKVKDSMTTTVVCTRPEMPIYDAVRLLAGRRITGLPVVDADLNLVGVLTEKDVLKMLYDTEDSPEQTVGDFMSRYVVSFDVNNNLIDLCDCLIDNPFRRVPVTENGKLAGVASRSDVIRAILRLKRQEVAN
jgi:CBS domain-containing protein